MFLTLDYYFKKSHCFKKRNHKLITRTMPQFRFKRIVIISAVKQRFEIVYIRAFKKFLRRSYCKAKMRFFKFKF